MIFSYHGLTQRLLDVQKQIHPDPETPEDPEDPGNEIQQKINEILAKIANLNAFDDPECELQGLRKSYATQLFSLWQEQHKIGVGYEIWNAYDICGVI